MRSTARFEQYSQLCSPCPHCPPWLQHNNLQYKTSLFNAFLERIKAHADTLREYPLSQKAATLSIGSMMDSLLNSAPGDK